MHSHGINVSRWQVRGSVAPVAPVAVLASARR